MSRYAVAIQELGFRYPGATNDCFRQLNLNVAEGDRFGLFGPNGAGKTTLLNCMTGLLSFKEGRIELLGKSLGENRKEISRQFGYVPQDFSFYHELSPVENLEFFGAWYGMEKTQIKRRSAEVLEMLDMHAVRDRQAGTFSGGMKRKLNLAIAVLHSPSILILDEPTVGVDVQTRPVIINYLKELNRQGATLIYTSHQLSEAEELCTTIALIDNGRIIAEGPLDKLLAEHREEGLERLFLNLTGTKVRSR